MTPPQGSGGYSNYVNTYYFSNFSGNPAFVTQTAGANEILVVNYTWQGVSGLSFLTIRIDGVDRLFHTGDRAVAGSFIIPPGSNYTVSGSSVSLQSVRWSK